MRKLLGLTDDLAILPHHVTAVRRNTLDDKDTCTVFVKGQSALEGFTVYMPFEDVIDEINQALAEATSDDTDHP